MKAYAENLRRKIGDAVRRGASKRETASLFGVSLASVKRFARMEREGDSLAPKKPWLRRSLREDPGRSARGRRSCLRQTSRIARRRPQRSGGAIWSISRARR